MKKLQSLVCFLLLSMTIYAADQVIQLHGHDGNGKPAVSRNRGRLGGVAGRPAHASDKHG